MAVRILLRFTTIGACDLTRAERNKATRKHRTDAERERQRRKGVIPREQYESRSLSRTRPWEAEGISRSTWERRRAKALTEVPVTRKKVITARQALASPTSVGRSILDGPSVGMTIYLTPKRSGGPHAIAILDWASFKGGADDKARSFLR